MTKIEISAWSLAQMFGLEYSERYEVGDYNYGYTFNLHSQTIKITDYDEYIKNEDHAKDIVACRMLNAIGIMVAGVIEL